MDKIADSLTQVDLSEIKVPMAVVYDNPEDYPGMYVCRIWEGGAGLYPTDTVVKKEDLEELREDIRAVGFTTKFPAVEGDAPTILETWMR